MDVFISVLICTIVLTGVKDVCSYEIPCKHYEVLVCGDADSEWAICQPKTQGAGRILSAQLDTRYGNRYCRRYGMPENFGLSSSGRSMWTVRWCYGTFFLCLELDSETSENFNGDNDLDNRGFMSDQYWDDTTTLQMSIQTSTHTTTQQMTESMTSSYNDNTSDLNNNEDTEPLINEDYISNEEYFENDLIPVNSSSSSTGHVGENVGHVGESVMDSYSMDPRMRFWLIFAIVGGGVIIVLVIAIIAYLTIHGCDSNKEYSLESNPKKSSGKKYFRQQKWSTSALVTSEPDSNTDVYDFIPAFKTKQTINISSENEQSDRQIHKHSDEKMSEKVKTEIYYISENDSVKRNNSSKRNDYFILIPHKLDQDSVNSDDSGFVNSHLTENIYDHLVHSSALSTPDSSTYHHLNFQRDLTLEETRAKSDYNQKYGSEATRTEFSVNLTIDETNAESDDNLKCMSDATNTEFSVNLIQDETSAKSDHNINYGSDATKNLKCGSDATNTEINVSLEDETS